MQGLSSAGMQHMPKFWEKCRRPDKIGKRPESDMMLQVWYVLEVFWFRMEVK